MVHFSGEYAIYALLTIPDSLPAGEAVAWFFTWLWAPALGLVVFLGLLFPTGRLPSRRWRPFAWISVLITILSTVLSVFAPGPILGLGSIRNPLGIEGFPNLYEPLQSLMLVLVLVGSASMLGRLRRARGVERQQIKWPAYTVVMAASGSVLTYTISETIGGRRGDLPCPHRPRAAATTGTRYLHPGDRSPLQPPETPNPVLHR
jgi:hypothetical protein